MEIKDQPRPIPISKRRIIFGLSLSLVTLLLVGLVFAEFELPVATKGQLQLQTTTKRLKMPDNSKIEQILVKPGDFVQKGQILLSFESTGAYQHLKLLEKDAQSLQEENEFYQSLINQTLEPLQAEKMIEKFSLSKERIFWVRNSLDTRAEYQKLQSQLIQSRIELNSQLKQLEIAANNPQRNLVIAENYKSEIEQIQEKINQNTLQIKQEQQSLTIAQSRTKQLKLLLEQGAISQIEYLNHQSEIQIHENNISNLYLEQKSLTINLNLAQQKLSQDNLSEDKKVFENISLKREKIANYQAKILSQEDQIKEINKNLKVIIAENYDKAQELNKNIKNIKQNIKSEKIYSPIKGQVLEINDSPQNQAKKETNFITIVPEEKIIAEIFIAYEDIPLIQENTQVEVSLNSVGKADRFKGTIISVGSDLLPPNQIYPFYRLPAQVSLSTQNLVINNQNLPLQVGMPVEVKIPVPQKRRIIKIIWQKLLPQIQQLKLNRIS
jgi:HlyD family secretion protein